MPLQRRFTTGDEELGKRDDDLRDREHAAMTSPTSTTTYPWRGPRRKRILLALLFCSILFFFFKNIPKDAGIATQRQGLKLPSPGSPVHVSPAPNSPPPRSDSSVDERRYYEGPIKYYHLASSFGSGLGPVHDNRNVLFVVSNLKSAASLLPLACDMSKQNKNRVHLMLTGRDTMAIGDIQKINGVTEADCSVKWHDGRPDFSLYSTDYRMEVSVRASLGHINSVMRPRVVLIDSPEREDSFFSKAINDKTRELGLPLIELPINAAEQLRWISKLDGSSLKAWNDINIEIVIHSSPESSGSLIRLLKSLENADYFGFPHPRLTIELPNNIDPPTSQYLSSFRWPPWSHAGNSKLTLRHRLLSNRLDVSQASTRQIESFYPSNVPLANILVLAPQVELSPVYFQYLVYTLLDYKYSSSQIQTSQGMMGISLERPLTTLDGKDTLSVPEEASSRSLFLYQAPNSNAALYFGDKWVELHSFLSNRFAVDKNLQSPTGDAYSVSDKYPSWLGYMLELARTRGYTMLYPTFPSSEDNIATVHSELYYPPEEHMKPTIPTSNPADTSSTPETPLTAVAELTALRFSHESQKLTTSGSILHLLNPHLSQSDSGGPLPDLSSLPVLSHTGEHLPQGQVSLYQTALTFSESFARNLGGCQPSAGADEKAPIKKRPLRTQWSADDLFCLDEDEMEANLGVGSNRGTSEAEEDKGDDAAPSEESEPVYAGEKTE
jgi:hypothetical protein